MCNPLTADIAQLQERRRAAEPRGCEDAYHHDSDTRTIVAYVRGLQGARERWTVPTIMDGCGAARRWTERVNGLPPPPGRDWTQAHVRVARVGGGVP